MQVKKHQLKLDMEQWTGSKLGKEYIKAVYCYPAYLTYMQSTSCKMLGWVKHKLESRFPGEIGHFQGLLRVPWTARRSSQSILKETNPEYSLEGLMLKPKLQYFGHLMQRTDSLEKTLILGRLRAGGEGDDRGLDGRMASPTQWTWVWASSGKWWRTGKPGLLQSIRSQRVIFLSSLFSLKLFETEIMITVTLEMPTTVPCY